MYHRQSKFIFNVILNKIVTFYDMNRSREQRKRIIKEIDGFKKQFEEKEKKEKVILLYLV